MSEILLQAIVEKLEALETALLRQANAGKYEEASNELTMAVKSIETEFIKISSTLSTNNKNIHGLSEEIRALRVNSGNPIQNQFNHVHHFHKQVWLSVSLFVCSLLLAYGWINCNNEKKSFEVNDMKYRYWKANGNTSLLKIVYQTDSLYNLNKDNFIKQVARAEHYIAEQQKLLRLADEKRKSNKLRMKY